MSTTDTQALIEELDEAAERVTRYSNSPLDGLLSAAARKLEELAALALAQPASQGWVGVDERMPELDVEVLVYKPASKYGQIQFDTWSMQHEAPLSFSSATIPIGFGWDNEDDFLAITHWHALPALPLAGDAQLQGEGKP